MTTSVSFQDNYEYHVGRNYYGQYARPGEPVAVDNGIAAEDLVPGDAVVFDPLYASRRFRKPFTETFTAWAQGTNYVVDDRVSQGGSNFICLRNHTSAGGNVADGAPGQSNATAWAAYTSVYAVSEVLGIVLYDQGFIPDANGNVVIRQNTKVRVGVIGSFYAKQGGDFDYGEQLTWDIGDGDFVSLATIPTNYSAAYRNPAFCVERNTEGNIFIVRFHGQIR